MFEQWPRERLQLMDFESGESKVLVEAAEGVELPQMSEDGRLVSFISGANWEGRNSQLLKQCWVMDLTTGLLRQVSAEESGVSLAVMSGDGTVFYALNGDGEIVRLTSTGDREVVLGATPWPVPSSHRRALVPGTRSHSTGTALGDAGVSVNGEAASVVRREPTRLDFIVPTMPDDERSIVTVEKEGTHFQPRVFNVAVRGTEPSIWTWGDHWPEISTIEGAYAWALHEDGERLITPEDPLRPGEWFEVQVTGVRIEDADRVIWEWSPASGETKSMETGPARLDPDLEGLLRVRLKAPLFEIGAEVWIRPRVPENIWNLYNRVPTAEPSLPD